MFEFFHESNIKRAIKNVFLKRQTNVVLLEPHFGLGDNLICIGLIRSIAEQNPKVRYYLACLPPYFHFVPLASLGLLRTFLELYLPVQEQY